jgi:acyl-homoserine-lactone acylase
MCCAKGATVSHDDPRTANNMKRLLTIFSLILFATVWFASYPGVAQEKVANTSSSAAGAELWRQVEIIRTAHGVPHIRAENLHAAGYALGWLQSEDYGPRTAMNVWKPAAAARVNGSREHRFRFSLDSRAQLVIKNYHLLDQDTRDVYEGIRCRQIIISVAPVRVPPFMPSDFNGYDVAAVDTVGPPLERRALF